MRVLSVIDSLGFGGAERSLVELAPGLLAAGCQLTVAVLVDRPGHRQELEDSGTPVHVIAPTGRLARAWAVRDLASTVHAHMIHTSLFEADVSGRLGAMAARLPTVSTLTSVRYGPEQFAEPGMSTARLRAAQTVDVLTAQTVRRFHAVSHSVADAMAPRLRVPRQRMQVVPRGRDPHRLGRRTDARRSAARRDLGLAEHAPVLVSVARHEHLKGLDVLVDATERLRSVRSDLVVLVAGPTGRATEDLRHQIDRAGLTGTIRLLGPRDDVPDLLCAADAFVLASRREGFPGAVVEAMAMEVPMVLSDLPMMREAVGDPTAATFVPVDRPDLLADAVSAVLADAPGNRRRTTIARRRFESELTVEATGRRMVELFESVLVARRR